MGAVEKSGDGIRIGDVERDRAADALGEHLRAGRLDMIEYDERVMTAFSARTRSDLTCLFVDLPGGSPLGPHPVQPGRQTRRGHQPTRRGHLPRRVLFVLLAVAGLVWMAVTRMPPFFLFPVLFFVLARRSIPRQDIPRRRRAHRRYGPPAPRTEEYWS